MNDVIVIGSNYSTALGTVRAVGMAGFGVRLLSTTQECADIIRGSRYIVKTVICEDAYEPIFRGLEELRGDDGVIPVIPTNDSSAMLLDQHAEALAAHYRFPNVRHTPGELVALMDKLKQKQLAKACGLPVAEGRTYPASEQGLGEALSEATYPCVTKAIASAECIGAKDLFRICQSSRDLEEILRMAIDKKCTYILVEQLLEVEKEYATYGLAWDGKVAMPACVDTWRSGHGAHKGVTAEGMMRSSDLLGGDRAKFEDFVRATGLNGLFCIDIIESRGKFYFVEINLRYGASGFAATMGGANLPGMLADVLANGGAVDETVRLTSEPQFLSEKVEIDDFRVGFMSWREYKQHQQGDKVRFMRSEDDPEPWNQFRRLQARKRLARLLRGKKRRH